MCKEGIKNLQKKAKPFKILESYGKLNVCRIPVKLGSYFFFGIVVGQIIYCLSQYLYYAITGPINQLITHKNYQEKVQLFRTKKSISGR